MTQPDTSLCPSCGMGVVDDPHYTATGVVWHGECMLAWGTQMASALGPHVAPLLGEQAVDADQRWHHLHQRAIELDAERTLNAGLLADAQAELEQAHARIAELQASAQMMGIALREYNAIALEITGTVPDPERGADAGYVDWDSVWHQVADLRPQLDAAHKRIAELEQRAGAAIGAHAAVSTRNAELAAQVAARDARIAELEAQRDRVRQVHQPTEAVNLRYPGGRLTRVCTGCGTDDGNWQVYPCPTIRALDSEEADHA